MECNIEIKVTIRNVIIFVSKNIQNSEFKR